VFRVGTNEELMKLLIYIFLICLSLVSCSKRDTEKQVVEQIKLTCSGSRFQSHSSKPYDGKTIDKTEKVNKTYIFTGKKINDVIEWNLEEDGSIVNLNLNYENLNDSGHPKRISSTFISDNDISITLNFWKLIDKNEKFDTQDNREIKINRVNGDWSDKKVYEVESNEGKGTRDYYLSKGTCERVKENKI